ncbi:MAG: hypothetical protein ABI114_15740 [Rhodanobacter sp.]
MNSPLSMSVRVLAARRRTRVAPRARVARVVGMAGAALLHALFLLMFVLGPAYEVEPPPPDFKAQVLRIRLIDTAEPPPAPSAPAEVPKQVGPTHQGHASRAAPARKNARSANQVSVPAKPVTPATPTAAAPAIAKAVAASAPTPKPAAAPKPPASLPKPAPTPDIQPIPLAGEPPSIAVATPSLKPPMPPKFQPEPVRPPQLEGTVAMPPPPSLALPPLPQQVPPPITVSSIAMTMDVPKSSAPASVVVARPQVPAAPAVPELQAIPLPAQESSTVKLDTQPSAPSPVVPLQLPRLQAPSIVVADAQLQAVPATPARPAQVTLAKQAVKVADTDKPAVAPLSVQRPQLSSVPAAEASVLAPAEPAPMSAPDQVANAADKPAVKGDATASEAEKNTERDVSTAPNASAQGSDTAKLGESTLAPTASAAASGQVASASAAAAGAAKTNAGKGRQQGELGGHQAGAAQGEKQGELAGYIQLKPTGDTTIMSHRVPGITYKATRFEQDWTPEGESSVDTALRRAVEKTTLKHTFHLPRGVRIKCVVMPLLPMSLLGCGGADPPPAPVADKVYDRLHMAPAKPLVAPAPAASSPSPVAAPMVKFNDAAQCAAARVAGSPPPPGCPETETLPRKTVTPAPSSSSWVPASDQFH